MSDMFNVRTITKSLPNEILTDSSLDDPGPAMTISFQEHISDTVAVDIMLLRDILDALESGLDSTREELAQHDRNLGRTTRKNQNYAELLEDEIRKTKLVIEKVKKLLQ